MKKLRKPSKRRTVPGQGVLVEKGINLVQSIVLRMHSRWIPTGANGSGIDGYIEFFDTGTGRSFGTTIAVQSRAVSAFQNEGSDSFEYPCKRCDVEYWLSGSMPVILVVSKPASKEAYWVDVKEYFSNPGNSPSTVVHFVKNESRFVPDSFHELIRVGKPADAGLYLPPLPVKETLFTNLLPVEGFPEKIYVASTELTKSWDVWGALRGKDRGIGGVWILKAGQIISFHNLAARAWSEICDPGTVTTIAASEWANSGDPIVKRDFVELCNQALRYSQNGNIRYWPEEDCYAFVGNLEKGTTKIAYRSVKHQARISAVTKFEGKGRNSSYKWLKHMAFKGEFRRLDGRWYLEITPTYRFTKDGQNPERFHEERLRAIRRTEGNRAVLSAVMFWADQLTAEGDLFDRSESMFKFGRLLKFEAPIGISDSEWSARNPEEETGYADVSGGSFLPFEGREV